MDVSAVDHDVTLLARITPMTGEHWMWPDPDVCPLVADRINDEWLAHPPSTAGGNTQNPSAGR